MRRHASLPALVACACWAHNSQFDSPQPQPHDDFAASTAMPDDAEGTGASGGGPGSHDASDATETAGDEAGPSTGTTRGDNETGVTECDFRPTEGLTLAFGDPAQIAGVCPTTFDIATRLSIDDDATTTFSVCSQGCSECDGSTHPIGIEPLLVTDHVPVGACLQLHAQHLLGAFGGTCRYGALTIYEPTASVPYLIATSSGYEPTPMGAALLSGALPEPQKAYSCSCDEIGLSDDCCYAGRPPERWSYPWPDVGALFAGDSAPLSLPHPADLPYSFFVFQAQRIPTCDDGDAAARFSWAVTAQL